MEIGDPGLTGEVGTGPGGPTRCRWAWAVPLQWRAGPWFLTQLRALLPRQQQLRSAASTHGHKHVRLKQARQTARSWGAARDQPVIGHQTPVSPEPQEDAGSRACVAK